jgi:prefoldin subunit 5
MENRRFEKITDKTVTYHCGIQTLDLLRRMCGRTKEHRSDRVNKQIDMFNDTMENINDTMENINEKIRELRNSPRTLEDSDTLENVKKNLTARIASLHTEFKIFSDKAVDYVKRQGRADRTQAEQEPEGIASRIQGKKEIKGRKGRIQGEEELGKINKQLKDIEEIYAQGLTNISSIIEKKQELLQELPEDIKGKIMLGYEKILNKFCECWNQIDKNDDQSRLPQEVETFFCQDLPRISKCIEQLRGIHEMYQAGKDLLKGIEANIKQEYLLPKDQYMMNKWRKMYKSLLNGFDKHYDYIMQNLDKDLTFKEEDKTNMESLYKKLETTNKDLIILFHTSEHLKCINDAISYIENFMRKSILTEEFRSDIKERLKSVRKRGEDRYLSWDYHAREQNNINASIAGSCDLNLVKQHEKNRHKIPQLNEGDKISLGNILSELLQNNSQQNKYKDIKEDDTSLDIQEKLKLLPRADRLHSVIKEILKKSDSGYIEHNKKNMTSLHQFLNKTLSDLRCLHIRHKNFDKKILSMQNDIKNEITTEEQRIEYKKRLNNLDDEYCKYCREMETNIIEKQCRELEWSPLAKELPTPIYTTNTSFEMATNMEDYENNIANIEKKLRDDIKQDETNLLQKMQKMYQEVKIDQSSIREKLQEGYLPAEIGSQFKEIYGSWCKDFKTYTSSIMQRLRLDQEKFTFNKQDEKKVIDFHHQFGKMNEDLDRWNELHGVQKELRAVLKNMPDKYRHLAQNLADREVSQAMESYQQILEGYQQRNEQPNARKSFEDASNSLIARLDRLDTILYDPMSPMYQKWKDNSIEEWEENCKACKLLFACFGDKYSSIISQDLAKDLEQYMDRQSECIKRIIQLHKEGKDSEAEKLVEVFISRNKRFDESLQEQGWLEDNPRF